MCVLACMLSCSAQINAASLLFDDFFLRGLLLPPVAGVIDAEARLIRARVSHCVTCAYTCAQPL